VRLRLLGRWRVEHRRRERTVEVWLRGLGLPIRLRWPSALRRGLCAIRTGGVVVRAVRVQIPARSAEPAVGEIPARDRFRGRRVDVSRRWSTRPQRLLLLMTVRLAIRLRLTLAGHLSMSGTRLGLW
jgi:hypothetical protein